MNCPRCGYKSMTTDSRYVPTKNQTRRRYVCLSCGHRFSTYEFYAEDYDKPKALMQQMVKAAKELQTFI